MNERLLRDGLASLGLPRDGLEAERLGRYIDAIESWNPTHGLVGASGDELIVKHILDSLAPLSIIDGLLSESSGPEAPGTTASTVAPAVTREAPTLVDLGSGAGLPGIPLAIARPRWSLTLLDRMTRRIRFLEEMKSTLGLDNVEVVEDQVERSKGSFDLVAFRAWKPFERKLFKRVLALCAPGGMITAYKGKPDKARAELAEIEGMYLSAEIIPLSVPFLSDERCLAVIRPLPK